jgi:hypothetical protein
MKASLKIAAKHTGDGLDLQQERRSFGELLGSVPGTQNRDVTWEGASFQEANEETQRVHLETLVNIRKQTFDSRDDVLTVRMFFANAIEMTRIDQTSSQEGINIDGRMNLSCSICAGMLPMMTPRLNQVPSQLRSLPYRLRSSFMPLTKALPGAQMSAKGFTAWGTQPPTVVCLIKIFDEIAQEHGRAIGKRLYQLCAISMRRSQGGAAYAGPCGVLTTRRDPTVARNVDTRGLHQQSPKQRIGHDAKETTLFLCYL